MKSPAALLVLAELSSSQWGMVTAAQAATRGVGRLDLSRLTKAGHLERLAHGVYRDAGAPSDEFESLRIAWLATDPSRTADVRLRDGAGGVVVMGGSAASLHGVGDLPADRHELSSPTRRQTQRPGISYRHRQLEPGDVTIAHGLPVTTVERTIADLVEARTDVSLVADVLRDAARTRRLDTDRLVELLGPLAGRNGMRTGDGAALLDRLTELAGLDTASLAKEIAASGTLGDLVAATSLARLSQPDRAEVDIDQALQTALRCLNDSIAQSVARTLAPTMKELAASLGMQSQGELQAATAQVAKKISLSLRTEELLASFGREWANELAEAPGASTEVLPAIDVMDAAGGRG